MADGRTGRRRRAAPAAVAGRPALDPELLAAGDARNVVDRYRYWRREAIVADLDTRRHPLHVAIENFGHDMNIGTVVRTANAFAVAAVHIVGRRAVEPARGDGHRPVPAPAAPPRRRLGARPSPPLPG